VIAADPVVLRRLAWRGLVFGLCVAALAACVALLRGSLDETEERVILTSVGFSVFSSLAGASATARLSGSEAARALGAATVGLAGTAFLLFAIGIWGDDWGSEGLWRAFGVAALLAVATAHAALVLASRRASDSETVRTLTAVSVGLGGLDALGALLPIVGLVDGIDEAGAQLLGVGLVLLVLTTALPPILRRIAQPAPVRGGAQGPLVDEVLQIADRLDALNSDPGNRAPEIRAEVARLRRLGESLRA
jgi:hypothetical protein